MLYVIVVFLFKLSVLASGKLNYCGARMCSYTNAHTFCQFSVGPGPQCIGYVEVPLTSEEKIKLVIRLNQRRAAVARGRLRGFPTAGNMMKLMWIEELAREAQLWADQCEPPSTPEKNDACRDLYSVGIGQCVASVIGEAPGLRPESMVDIWYMQNMFYRGNVTAYDPPVNQRYNYYGDFAQLVHSKTYMVGCGRSRFMALLSGRLRSVERLVCNFAPRGPNAGRPLWTVASPGSACPPRSLPDDNVPALCTVKRDLEETHDQDNLMSLEENILLETVFEIERNESLNYFGSLDEMYLTKLAAATITDVVTIPMDYNTVLNQNLFEDYTHETNPQAESSISTATHKPTTTVVLVGRHKSYKIEDLNHESDDNPDTEMQDLPIRGKLFDVDYEFSDSNEERRPIIFENSTDIINIVALTVTDVATTQLENTIPSTPFYEEQSTKKDEDTIQNTINEKNIPSYSKTIPSIPFYQEQSTIKEEDTIKNTINEQNIPSYNIEVATYNTLNINNNTLSDKNNETVTEIDTDALLEEYLSDPDTVRRLQEELDRMEQALSVDTSATTNSETTQTTSERADKVRRSLKDGIADRVREGIDNISQMSKPLLPDMMQPFSGDENNSVAHPMMSMAMRYIPYFRNYKSTFSHSYRISSSFILIVTCIFVRLFYFYFDLRIVIS